MEENVQELLKDKDENVVQFNFENNTSIPVAITLFDTSSLTTIPTSGSLTNTYTASNDLLPSLPPSILAQNTFSGTIIASDLSAPILRLINTNTTENNFNNSIGFNGTVVAITIQPDGKILVGGAFTTYKGLTENRIIRLNSDGTKDLTFDNSIGFNGTVVAITIQPDGKIVCGGQFTTYKGLTENRIIRLNLDGTKDLTFDNSIGFNNGVNAIRIQPDGKILVGGTFNTYKGYNNNAIINLQSSGLSASTLNLSSILNTIIFADTNNVFYASDSTNTYVVDYNGEQAINTIPYPATSSTYNSNNNSLYLLDGSNIRVIDCLTLSLVATISITNTSLVLSNLTTSNYIYFFDEITSLLQKIDCSTNDYGVLTVDVVRHDEIKRNSVNPFKKPYWNGNEGTAWRVAYQRNNSAYGASTTTNPTYNPLVTDGYSFLVGQTPKRHELITNRA